MSDRSGIAVSKGAAETMRMIGKLVSCAASALWVHAAVQ